MTGPREEDGDYARDFFDTYEREADRLARPRATGMTLAEARTHIADGVTYTPRHGSPEDGVITSVGDIYVFVRYGGDRASKATRPQDLSLLIPDGPK